MVSCTRGHCYRPRGCNCARLRPRKRLQGSRSRKSNGAPTASLSQTKGQHRVRKRCVAQPMPGTRPLQSCSTEEVRECPNRRTPHFSEPWDDLPPCIDDITCNRKPPALTSGNLSYSSILDDSSRTCPRDASNARRWASTASGMIRGKSTNGAAQQDTI